MNWYIETELRHGTVEWVALKEIFIWTFSFESGFHCIDEALKDIRDAIFDVPREPIVRALLD